MLARRTLLAFLSITALAPAEEGKTLYNTFCAACHSTDGKGANNAAFPALAKSRWIKGDPDRAVQIILHGLTGEIEVLGKNYNLQMPPQGAMLNDDQIASILTYVRGSWDNKEAPVSAAQVAAIRKKSANHEGMWKAEELLKKYPLPTVGSPIKNLLRTTYVGKWKKLPDFSKLKSVSVEEEHHGFLNLDNIEAKDHFGVVWEGELEVPADGQYKFVLDSDDGSALYLDGKKTLELNSTGPLYSRGQASLVDLKKGSIPIRVEYFEASDKEDIVLWWSGPEIVGNQWMSVRPRTKRKRAPLIDITPTGEKSSIYNNFLHNTTPRSISFGHPNGANFTFSSKNCSLSLIWSGKFINAGSRWNSRGVGKTNPLGKNLAILGNDAFVEGSTIQFRGYTLDQLRRPTFQYTVDDANITDAIMPGDSANQLNRTITLEGKKSLSMTIATDIPVMQKDKNTFVINKKWQLKISDIKGKIANNKLTLELTPGTHTISYTLLP